ncbi:MAG: lipoprotein-anchoring transpeptidase ErfK/SrfK [Verrucomicrobiales bacterium]|jgi:lipoprotein-anchoring transpeptidase ErfK/SrfK
MRSIHIHFSFLLATALFVAGCVRSPNLSRLPVAAAAGSPNIRMIEVNAVQGHAFVDDDVYQFLTPENARIEISLSEQRARIFAGDRIAIDTPIATGVAAHPTPSGSFTILEKKTYHESSLYGNYVDANGQIVLRDVSSRVNKAPPASRWVGTPVPFWQRLTWDGVGMHVGKLPGYPASHGCLRFPSTVMPLIFARTRVGTPVEIY